MSGPVWENYRKPLNDRSQSRASHHHEEWSQDELDFLESEWNGFTCEDRDEEAIAEILGRTVEACRWRASYIKRQQAKPVKRHTTTTTTTTTTSTEYVGAFDDPEDKWW